jgi:hypothetical protein
MVGFWYKIQFLNFEGENQKPLGFHSKFKIWMKNNKSTDIFGLSLNFFGLSLCFLVFDFQFFSHLKKIKLNQLIFGKLIKPIRMTSIELLSFCKNRNEPFLKKEKGKKARPNPWWVERWWSALVVGRHVPLSSISDSDPPLVCPLPPAAACD